MVEHHLVLSDVATRRDLDDPEVIARVAGQLGSLPHPHRITAAIAELDLDIVRARVHTGVDEVVDSFYVQDASGGKVPESVLDEVRRAILHAV